MRLVALTGYSDSATRKLAADAGFDDFFVKPFSSENLAHLLNH
jgi:CheY-like chemotaxis protein